MRQHGTHIDGVRQAATPRVNSGWWTVLFVGLPTVVVLGLAGIAIYYLWAKDDELRGCSSTANKLQPLLTDCYNNIGARVSACESGLLGTSLLCAVNKTYLPANYSVSIFKARGVSLNELAHFSSNALGGLLSLTCRDGPVSQRSCCPFHLANSNTSFCLGDGLLPSEKFGTIFPKRSVIALCGVETCAETKVDSEYALVIPAGVDKYNCSGDWAIGAEYNLTCGEH